MDLIEQLKKEAKEKNNKLPNFKKKRFGGKPNKKVV